MSENKPTDLTPDVLLADVMLRLTALEKLLVSSGVISEEALKEITDVILANVSKIILEKVEAAKDLKDFVVSLDTDDKNLKN